MKKSTPVIISALVIYIGLLPTPCGAREQLLRINCTLHSPYETFFFELVKEICDRNHIEVERNTPPVGRSLIHVNEGIDDGDGPRISGLSSTFPNLIKIPEPFGEFIFGAFAKSEKITVDGWSSLKDLNVAYVLGWKIFDNHVTAARSVTKVKNKDLLFGMLDAGRADVALLTKLAGYAAIQKSNLENMRFLEPPLAIEPNFLYLHKRHQRLAPNLAQTLREIKTDGTYQRLYRKIISPDLPEQH